MMKKMLLATLIAVLMLGTFLTMARAYQPMNVKEEDDHEQNQGVESRDEDSYEEKKDVGTEEQESSAGEKESEEQKVNDDGEEEAGDAMDAIREAEDKLQEARDKIEKAKTEVDGQSLAEIESLWKEANNTFYEAKEAYENKDYEMAEQLAGKAEDQADRVTDLVEDISEKTRQAEHEGEEEDKEEAEDLEAQEDESSNLHIISNDNSVEFNKEEPKIEFEYSGNGTKIGFEAKDFALVEFSNSRTLKYLEFDEIQWNVTFEKTIQGTNTIINVTYYANGTEYEIALVMHLYQRSVTESSISGNASIVFDVDGGADEVKIDLVVKRWKWIDSSSRLTLLMKLEAEFEGEIALKSAGMDEDQIAIKLDDIAVKVSWVKKAEIVHPDGTSEFVDVTVTYKSMELELEGDEVGLELEANFTYPYFGSYKLIHDPSIGIEDDPLAFVFSLINQELLIGTGIVAMVIVVASVALSQAKKLRLGGIAPLF